MNRIEISRNVFQYKFVSKDRSFSDNIYVIHSGKKAILIDTAFEENAKMVKEDLKNQGIIADRVIISHFHDDHIMGNKVFAECEFFIHPVYSQQVQYRDIVRKTFKDCSKLTFVENGMNIKLEEIDIDIYFAPGHHISGLTIVIDKKIVFANDLIIYSNDGKMVIPYIDSGSTIDEHIGSLEFIKTLNPEILISGHGTVIDKEKINNNIDQRVYYLSQLNKIGSDADIKDCLLDEIINYSHVGFHFSNLQKVFKRVL